MLLDLGRTQVHLDQWVEFEDEHGHGYACIDGFAVGEKCVLAWECKLTYTPEMAWWQLEKRYAPLLRHLFQRPVATLQVCRNLAFGYPIPSASRRSPRYLLENPEPGRFTHHWLGR